MRLIAIVCALVFSLPVFAAEPLTQGPYNIYPDKGGMTSPPGPEWTSGNNLLFIHKCNNVDLTRWKFEGALCSHAVKVKDELGKTVGVHLYIVGIQYGFVRVRQYDENGNQISLYLIAYDAPRIGGPPKTSSVVDSITKADVDFINRTGTADQKEALKRWTKNK